MCPQVCLFGLFNKYVLTKIKKMPFKLLLDVMHLTIIKKNQTKSHNQFQTTILTIHLQVKAKLIRRFTKCKGAFWLTLKSENHGKFVVQNVYSINVTFFRGNHTTHYTAKIDISAHNIS